MTFSNISCPVVLALALLSSHTATASECIKGTLMSEKDGWEYIENNAARTADAYAVANNPAATFVLAKTNVAYQFGGDFEGQYLIVLLAERAGNTDFAMLRPNFDICGKAASLDDSRSDLFEVVVAKHNGQPF